MSNLNNNNNGNNVDTEKLVNDLLSNPEKLTKWFDDKFDTDMLTKAISVVANPANKTVVYTFKDYALKMDEADKKNVENGLKKGLTKRQAYAGTPAVWEQRKDKKSWKFIRKTFFDRLADNEFPDKIFVLSNGEPVKAKAAPYRSVMDKYFVEDKFIMIFRYSTPWKKGYSPKFMFDDSGKLAEYNLTYNSQVVYTGNSITNYLMRDAQVIFAPLSTLNNNPQLKTWRVRYGVASGEALSQKTNDMIVAMTGFRTLASDHHRGTYVDLGNRLQRICDFVDKFGDEQVSKTNNKKLKSFETPSGPAISVYNVKSSKLCEGYLDKIIVMDNILWIKATIPLYAESNETVTKIIPLTEIGNWTPDNKRLVPEKMGVWIVVEDKTTKIKLKMLLYINTLLTGIEKTVQYIQKKELNRIK